MDIAAQKLLAIVVIWLIGLVAGLWPVLIGARTPHDRFFSLGNALAGGVFLGAGLIHLLPDAIDSYRAGRCGAGRPDGVASPLDRLERAVRFCRVRGRELAGPGVVAVGGHEKVGLNVLVLRRRRMSGQAQDECSQDQGDCSYMTAREYAAEPACPHSGSVADSCMFIHAAHGDTLPCKDTAEVDT